MLRTGDLVAVYNEERYPYHHDSGRTMMARSKDGGQTWSEPKVVIDWIKTEAKSVEARPKRQASPQLLERDEALFPSRKNRRNLELWPSFDVFVSFRLLTF